MRYRKPNRLYYRIAQAVCAVAAKLVFRCKVLRNEIKGVTGPYVVIANHQAALDFVNLIGMTRRPMSFVISNSFFRTLPITGYLTKMGVIPKQQFQTTVADMKNMKAVVDAGEPLVIYPAGLMCEDGLSTPIPTATYKFLKWMNVDIYVARISGTYFAMPKWAGGLRPGKTFLDVYKFLSKEELAKTDLDTLREKTDRALMYDAYREQEAHMVSYSKCDDIRGLEHVLYMCPRCGAEHMMQIRGKSAIFCRACGYEQVGDRFGFLHNYKGVGPEIRYVSDWSRMIYDRLRQQIREGIVTEISSPTAIHMIDNKRHKFVEVGQGTVTLRQDGFHIRGTIHGEAVDMTISTEGLPTLPFSPGKYLEIQDGKKIYRCVLADGNLVMKMINMVKIYYTMNHPTPVAVKK